MEKRKIMKEAFNWLLHIGVAFAIGVLITTFAVQATTVYSCSMEPTLQEGNKVWVDKVSPKLGNITRGDIVIIYSPKEVPEDDHLLIKRVVALENDLLEIKEGKVYVNGQVIKEDYIKGDYTDGEGGQYSKMKVPQGYVYVLGDNRSVGIIDSRNMGPVSMDRIRGKAFFRTYPFNEFGGL